MKKRILVIGAGRFGRSVIQELHAQGHSVVACDENETLIEDMQSFIHHGVIGDSTDPSVLDDLQVTTFDAVIVAIGTNFETAAYTVGLLKEKGCPRVTVKALDEFKGKLLRQIGADHVVFPEMEAGVRLARQIANPGVLQHVQLAPGYGGMEVEVPAELIGQTLAASDFRRKYHLSVLVVSRPSHPHPILSPSADMVLLEGDLLFVVGENEHLDRLKRRFS